MAGGGGRFRPSDYLIRFVCIYALLLATYNPTGYSYADWLVESDFRYFPVKLLVGFALFLVYRYIYAMAYRALLTGGFRLAYLFFASGAVALYSQGLMPENLNIIIVLVEASIAAVLAAGLSLVPLWQHISGQVTATPEVH